MKKRSPDLFELKPEQMKARLADKAENVREHADYIFENNGPIEDSIKRFADLIYKIIRS